MKRKLLNQQQIIYIDDVWISEVKNRIYYVYFMKCPTHEKEEKFKIYKNRLMSAEEAKTV